MPDGDDELVTVPTLDCPLLQCDVQVLKQTIMPTSFFVDYGIDLYQATLDFVHAKLQTY